ncbi:unnamed protein product [Mytilus coruscus]|uniref:Ig-like domain-containing protein n=1 Tax=Mytilus coruscus TaxID=42192 RepID=A0A6J8EN07_MYTCO|nr:unnamed protein product [Mytilus coruscus]
MQFELLMCVLLHISNGNKTFVKEYTTAEIICPLKLTEKDNVSWYYEESKPIVIMNVINPEFKFKYSINSALNKGKLSINIYNFTESDEGKYSCQGIVSGEHKEGIVTVSLCRMMKTNKDKLRGQTDTYICFMVNEDQCIITGFDSEFHIKIEWVSSEEREHRRFDNNELYIYTCTCNPSSVEENVSCNESIDTYYLNKTLLFKDSKMANNGIYQCSLAQNKTDNRSTNTRLPKWVNLRSSDFENTNRLNSESERVSDNRPISNSSRSSITLFHFYINTSIGSTNNMPARYENELNHPSQLGPCDIWTNNSYSNNTSESGTLQVNQYMNIANSDFPNEYEDLKHLSGDTHTYETLP